VGAPGSINRYLEALSRAEDGLLGQFGPVESIFGLKPIICVMALFRPCAVLEKTGKVVRLPC